MPTRNGHVRLSRCLRALRKENEALPGLEVIVVDDGSVDGEAVAAVADREGARLVRRSAGGVGAARNAGARAASAPILCFTDDDCIPETGWVGRLLSHFADGAEVVGGPTQAGMPQNRLAVAHQLVSNALMGDRGQNAFLAPMSNLACRAEIVDAVPFDETYGRLGAEDRDWYARVAEAGCRLVFEPAAVVLHFPELSFTEFVGRQFRYGRGAFRYRQRHCAGRLERASFYAQVVRQGFAKGPAIGGLVSVAQLATAAGYALEAIANGSGRSQ